VRKHRESAKTRPESALVRTLKRNRLADQIGIQLLDQVERYRAQHPDVMDVVAAPAPDCRGMTLAE